MSIYVLHLCQFSYFVKKLKYHFLQITSSWCPINGGRSMLLFWLSLDFRLCMYVPAREACMHSNVIFCIFFRIISCMLACKKCCGVGKGRNHILLIDYVTVAYQRPKQIFCAEIMPPLDERINQWLSVRVQLCIVYTRIQSLESIKVLLVPHALQVCGNNHGCSWGINAEKRGDWNDCKKGWASIVQ